MKSIRLVTIVILASLLVPSCGVTTAPDADTQSIILTQSAQINKLSTSVAAGNEPPTEEPADDPPMQMGPDMAVYLVNDYSVPICRVYFRPSGMDGDFGANLVTEEIDSLTPGYALEMILPSGRYDVRIYDCANTHLLTQEDEVLVDSDKGWLYLSAVWVSDPLRGFFYVYNSQNVPICAVRVSEIEENQSSAGPNLLYPDSEITQSRLLYFSYPSGTLNIYAYDCNGTLVDVAEGFVVDFNNYGFDVDGLWGGVAEDPGGGEPTFTANQETNCRRGPSSSAFAVSETVFAGESVPIVGVGKSPAQEWWVVVQDGVECWVWMDTGTASGDTSGVPGVTPPALPPTVTPPTAGQGADPGDEQPATCPEPNQVVQVEPSNGAHPTTFTFSISGFAPDITLYFTIYLRQGNQVVYETELASNANGNATFQLSTEASDPRGQYEVWVMAFDKDMCVQTTDAVFILE